MQQTDTVAMAIWAANEGTRWVKNWEDLEPAIKRRYRIMADAALEVMHLETRVTGKVLAIPAKTRRGTRLPQGYVPPDEKVQQMLAELACDKDALIREHRKFVDHFLSAPGQRGVKLDWDRTWCNWMRTASERGSLRGVRSGRNNDDKISELMEMQVNAEGE